MLHLKSLLGRKIRWTVTGVFLAYSLTPLSVGNVHAGELGTVIGVIQKAYSLFNTGKSLFSNSDSLETLLEEATREIISQVRDQELRALVESLVDRYGELVRNSGSNVSDVRMANFLDDSSDVFERLNLAITEGSPESAYALLPAFNVITVLRVGAMQELGYDHVSIDNVFNDALFVNHRAVGASFGFSRLFFGYHYFHSTIESSILWNAPQFNENKCAAYVGDTAAWLTCLYEAAQEKRDKYNADEVVQIAREAMRQMMNLGFREVGRYTIIWV